MLPNTANAPGPADQTYPSMSEAEFAAHFTVAYLSGGVGGLVERKVAFHIGTSLGGRMLAGSAGGASAGGLMGAGSVGVNDAFNGRLSPADHYAQATMFGVAPGGVLGAVFGTFQPAPNRISDRAMEGFAAGVYQQNPILQRLSRIWRATEPTASMSFEQVSQLNATRMRQTEAVLDQFTTETGITVERVANGAVQRATGTAGNFASLNSRPGTLQIEAHVFESAERLLNEVSHELAYFYTRAAWARAGGMTTPCQRSCLGQRPTCCTKARGIGSWKRWQSSQKWRPKNTTPEAMSSVGHGPGLSGDRSQRDDRHWHKAPGG